MKSRDKKLVVLRLLSLEDIPIALSEVLEKLDGEFKERTVRRWLNEMAKDGLVEKTGSRRGTKYQVVHTTSDRGGAADSSFGAESFSAIEYVRKPMYERRPTSYDNLWLESYKPNSSFYLPEELRGQLKKAGARATINDPAGTYAHQIFTRLLIDLSYNSSRLEGNTYSLLDTQRLILSGEIAEGKLDEEKVMILNHKEAIRYLVEHARRLEVSQETVCTLHYLLSDGLVESKYAGKVRDHWVRISGSTYIPYEDPRKLQALMQKIVGKAVEIRDPFEQSLFLLVHLSYLQAFSDVNRRTARLCANIPLVVENLVPLSFNDVERGDYMSAIIAVYELQDVRPMVDLFVFSYLRSCAAYNSTVKAMGFDEIRVRYRAFRRELLREVVDQKLVGSPLETYIESRSAQEIPAADRSAFVEDVVEDLEQIDHSRIAGLGLAPEQLIAWKEMYLKSKSGR